MKNTILLMRGFAELTVNEYKKFKKYDTLMGNDSNPEELKKMEIYSRR